MLDSDVTVDGDLRVFRVDLAPDTYLILVQRSSGQGGYTISSSFTGEATENDTEPNNSPGEALALEFGVMATGRLGFRPFPGNPDADE